MVTKAFGTVVMTAYPSPLAAAARLRQTRLWLWVTVTPIERENTARPSW